MHAHVLIPSPRRVFALAAAAIVAATPVLLLKAQDESMAAPPTATAAPNGDWSQLPSLDQLVAPVALYPDPLLGLVLPASTEPNDLQAAASVGDAGQGASDPAVQGLSHYPDVLHWMASNQDWSQQLGSAFADQPNQVMDAVQDLRHRAIAAGTLQSNDQIDVVQTNGIVQILPKSADMVYVPRYDAGSVYFRGGVGASITWGVGLPAGAWLTFFPAWDHHALYTGDWYTYSRSHGGWRHAAVGGGLFAIGSSGMRGAKEWSVSANAQIRQGNYRQHEQPQQGHYARPAAMSGSGNNNYGYRGRDQRAPTATNPSLYDRSRGDHPATFQGDDLRRPDPLQQEPNGQPPAAQAEQPADRSATQERSTDQQRATDENRNQQVERQEQSAAPDRQSQAEQNRAEQSRAEQNGADQARAEQNRAEQNRPEQNQTDANRTEQARTTQGQNQPQANRTEQAAGQHTYQARDQRQTQEQPPRNAARQPNEESKTKDESPSASAPSSR